MIRTLTKLSLAVAAMAACQAAVAAAVLIAGSAPDVADGPAGEPATLALGTSQTSSFDAGLFVGYRLTRIEWWGFDFFPPPENEFNLSVNGTPVLSAAPAGIDAFTTFPIPAGDVTLFQYSVDLTSLNLFALGSNANAVVLQNTAADADWYWQYAAGSQTVLAFQVFGEEVQGTVPEPSSLLLVALAGMALVATRQRN